VPSIEGEKTSKIAWLLKKLQVVDWHYKCHSTIAKIRLRWTFTCCNSYSIFHNVVPSLPHFESKWLASLRHFLRMIQGTLRLDTTFVPETHIMDHVLEQGLFSKREIGRINYCRLYLQAVTVSHISLASGTSLAPGIRNGHPTLWSRVTRYLKTNQACPNAATWKIWSQAMDLLATPDDLLYVALRQWMVPPSRQRRLWPA
jgi:hypothetical protein